MTTNSRLATAQRLKRGTAKTTSKRINQHNRLDSHLTQAMATTATATTASN
jgi:hypothetical protein